jgi:lipopolysaccharide export system ATP-binding protein
MTVYFTNDNKVSKIVATGDVVITQPNRVTHCGHAEYYQDSDTFDLTQEPVILDHNDQVSGPEIIVDRKSQTMTVKGPRSRVVIPNSNMGSATTTPSGTDTTALPKPKSPKKPDRIVVDDYSGADIDNGAAVIAAAAAAAKSDAQAGAPVPAQTAESMPAKSKIALPPPLPQSSPKKDEAVPDLPTSNGADHPFLIQTRGLVKQYGGRRVVNGVDIYVRPGEVVGLLGKNGAGKTTTFYMIVGLVTPTEGHVFMGDEDVTLMPMYRRARRGIGYLPQEESIFRKLNVEDNLLAILETLPMTEEERDTRCDELLRDFGLEHVRENIAITLSGGEKRRVTIARALVTSPQLLLLDEPFSGVDPMAVHDIQEIILSLKRKGLGVLITDHNVRETLSVVDRAYIIDEGRVLSEGTREFLLNDPIAREIYLGHRFSM